ncbi:MAG: hypothetical protein MUP85_08695 [Candidatus Lokiarchaeota archaeon]|nr:hypothetical protein [Candidatus Lokiarchaeota archaeon]
MFSETFTAYKPLVVFLTFSSETSILPLLEQFGHLTSRFTMIRHQFLTLSYK